MYRSDVHLIALIPDSCCRASAVDVTPSLAPVRRDSFLSQGRSGLLLWVTLLCCLSALSLADPADKVSQSRFQRTVQYLQTAAPELRGGFAAIALTHLADAYVDEAQLARTEARAGGHAANLGGWSAMVDYYAQQMPLLLADIELGLPVQLTLGGEQSLAITVADRIVIVSPPRLTQQQAFEQKILVDFCQAYSCEEISPKAALPHPIAAASSAIRPDWTFSAQGPVCAYQGISVHFESGKNLSNARVICEQFLREVINLTDELALQQRHGVVIDWENLRLAATAHSPEHVVAVNAMGDTVVVTVPLLYRSAGLLQHVLPWIRQWLTSQQGASITLNAADYGWQRP